MSRFIFCYLLAPVAVSYVLILRLYLRFVVARHSFLICEIGIKTNT